MARGQVSFFRDPTFSYGRRMFGTNIPATDIDSMEYDNMRPVALIEEKSISSPWLFRPELRISLRPSLALAEAAGVPFYVRARSLDCSTIHLYQLDFAGRPGLIAKQTLPEHVAWLYRIRNRGVPGRVAEMVPDRLEPITRAGLIARLFRELELDDRAQLVARLLEQLDTDDARALLEQAAARS